MHRRNEPAEEQRIATLATGAAPAGVAINRAGTVGLGGAPDCGANHVAISPDGRSALVTLDNDHKVSVLAIDGPGVSHTQRDLDLGLRPYGIDFCVPGSIAVLAIVGAGQGDADTISVIDMMAQPPRIIETLSVGQTPRSIKCSPGGTDVAVVVMSGGNTPKAWPFFNPKGMLVLYRVAGNPLQKFGELPRRAWPSHRRG